MRDGVNRLHYYLNDHLGSARVVIDSAGTIKDKYHYLAFGSPLDMTTSTGQPNKYTGKTYDMDAGMNLYYYGARYYDSELGRFTQVDPAGGDYPEWSGYVYTLDNPLKHTDPDGRNPLLIAALGGAVVGGAVGAGVEYLSQKSNGHIFEPSQYDMSRPVQWGKVGDAAVQWGAVGAVVGLTGPSGLNTTLAKQALATAATSAAYGSAIREKNGQTTTVNDVAADALGGAAAPLAKAVAGQVVKTGVSQFAASGAAAVGGGKTAQELTKKAVGGFTEEALNQFFDYVIENVTFREDAVKQP